MAQSNLTLISKNRTNKAVVRINQSFLRELCNNVYLADKIL